MRLIKHGPDITKALTWANCQPPQPHACLLFFPISKWTGTGYLGCCNWVDLALGLPGGSTSPVMLFVHTVVCGKSWLRRLVIGDGGGAGLSFDSSSRGEEGRSGASARVGVRLLSEAKESVITTLIYSFTRLPLCNSVTYLNLVIMRGNAIAHARSRFLPQTLDARDLTPEMYLELPPVGPPT